MKKLKNWLMEEESGQGMVEYGLILTLISIAVIAVLTTIGTNLDARFDEVDTELQ